MTVEKKVFYITGASKGFGLSLTNNLLEQGFNVIATSRNKEQLIKNVDSKFVNENNFLPLKVDITSCESVKKSIEDSIAKFTRIDVIINNAGYGIAGTVEELTDKEVRDNFDCNVFGVINVIRYAAPYLRKNKHFADGPRIINISSVAGFFGEFPAFGIYSSTKFALDGLTEALSQDFKEFGIHVTSVKPGYFRTSFLDKSSFLEAANPIKDYTAVRKVEETHVNTINNNQQGDPEKGAKAIIQVALMPSPPLHFFLGSDSIKFAKQKIQHIEKDIESLLTLSTSTDFDKK